MCVRESSFEDAVGLCEELGSRLCTAAELERGESVPEACGFDSAFVWSWVSGGVAQCSGNSSLGVAGRPGEWFSFRPAAANALIEVRLLAEGQAEGEISSSIAPDIFDGHGDRVPTPVPPTLHSRRDGSMLRWNTSMAGTGPFFVRVMATAQHSVVMAALEPYVAVSNTARASNWSAAAPLLFSNGVPAVVRLPFPFMFFGVEQQQIWVSLAGYILFEEQRSGAFADVGSSHSAVVACAGEFETEAPVTMMQSETELQVQWRGALFNSSKVSDVSLSLHRSGSVSIEWAAVHLASGGSLGSGLATWLLSDPAAQIWNTSLTVADGAQIQDETGGTRAGAVVLGAHASASVVPMDASRYFGASADVRLFHQNSTSSQGSPCKRASSSPNAVAACGLRCVTCLAVPTSCSFSRVVRHTNKTGDRSGGGDRSHTACRLHDYLCAHSARRECWVGRLVQVHEVQQWMLRVLGSPATCIFLAGHAQTWGCRHPPRRNPQRL